MGMVQYEGIQEFATAAVQEHPAGVVYHRAPGCAPTLWEASFISHQSLHRVLGIAEPPTFSALRHFLQSRLQEASVAYAPGVSLISPVTGHALQTVETHSFMGPEDRTSVYDAYAGALEQCTGPDLTIRDGIRLGNRLGVDALVGERHHLALLSPRGDRPLINTRLGEAKRIHDSEHYRDILRNDPGKAKAIRRDLERCLRLLGH